MQKLVLFYYSVLLLISPPDLTAQKCLDLDQILNKLTGYSIDCKNLKNTWCIRKIQYENSLAKWHPTAQVGLSLPYSKSIEAILKPDGSTNFVQRTYTCPGLTFTSSKQFSATGGSISVSSSIGLLKDFTNNTANYNSNWFNVSITQPLFSFNDSKYSKLLAEKKIINDSLKYYTEKETQIKKIVEAILDFEIARRKKIFAEQIITECDSSFEKTMLMYKNGKALADDTMQMAYNRLKAKLEQQRVLADVKSKELMLSSLISQPYEYIVCDLLDIPAFEIDTSFLTERYLKYNAFKEMVVDSFETAQGLKRVKKSTGVATSINLGVGAQKYTQDFNYLYAAPSQQQNASISISMPITGWQTYKRNISVAKIQLETYRNQRTSTVNNASQWAQNIYERNLFVRQAIQLSIYNIKRLHEHIKISYLLFLAGKVELNEYSHALSDLNVTEQELLDFIRQIILIRFEIRQKTLYDCLTNKSISND